MSVDAKAWQEDDGCWRAIHDGDCPDTSHEGDAYDLVEVLQGVASCMGVKRVRWELRAYPDSGGKLGLVGWGY